MAFALSALAAALCSVGCRDPYPDEWGRFCGEDADSGQEADCEPPFECVLRTDVTWATEPSQRHVCSVACESDADCSADLGTPVPECNKSVGFCKDYASRE